MSKPDSETIVGLLTQKPSTPAPQPGDEMCFTWEERKGKSGKPWIKIKNAREDEGGRICEVIDAQQTDYTDSHGNVSFNVEFSPIYGREPKTAFRKAHDAMHQDAPQTSQDGVRRPFDNGLDTRQRAIIRQHSQSMALEVLKLKVTLNELTVEDLTPAKLRQLADYFDADVLGGIENGDS